MKRYLKVISLTAGLGLLTAAAARPTRTAAAAHVLLARVGFAAAPAPPAIRATAAAHDETTQGTVRNVTLSRPTVSLVDDNRVVVVMDAGGDLRGALTLGIDRDASGTGVTGGEWALVVAYTEVTAHDDGDAGEEGVPDHHEELVQKGVIKGTISGGQLTLNADGSIASVGSLQLAVDGGSVTYADVTSGGGTAQLANLQDVAAASGSLSLSF
jgi:hypothetical protein